MLKQSIFQMIIILGVAFVIITEQSSKRYLF